MAKNNENVNSRLEITNQLVSEIAKISGEEICQGMFIVLLLNVPSIFVILILLSIFSPKTFKFLCKIRLALFSKIRTYTINLAENYSIV
jgi:hypothetical protein